MLKDITIDNVLDNNYKIDENGQIYSNFFKSGLNSSRKMSTFIDRDGYERIKLKLNTFDPITGKRNGKGFGVHTLVIKTFLGNPPKNMCDPTVDHIDGNKINNHISNLRWLSRSENSILANERYRNEGEKKYNLDNVTAKNLISDILNGKMGMRDLIFKYKIPKTYILDIMHKRKHCDLTKDIDFVDPKDLHHSLYSVDDLTKVCELISKGYTRREVANKSGIPISVVANIARGHQGTYVSKNFDFSKSWKPRVLFKREIEEICLYRKFNFSNPFIKDAIGISTKTISAILNRRVKLYNDFVPVDIDRYSENEQTFSIFDICDGEYTLHK